MSAGVVAAHYVDAASGGAMPSYIGGVSGQVTGNNSPGTTINLVIPAATQAGDLILVVQAFNGQSSAVLAVPAGFTSRHTASIGSASRQTQLLQRWAVAGDAGSTVSFTTTDGFAWDRETCLVVYRGVDATANPAMTAGASTGATATAPAVTTPVDNCRVVALFAMTNSVYNGSLTIVSVPPTERQRKANAGGYCAAAVSDEPMATVGTRPARSMTMSGGNDSRNYSVILKPAA